MDFPGLAVFATALLIAAASPGPGIAAIVARVLGRGTQGAIAFTAGVAIGDVVWLTVAVLGLAALAQTFHGVFLGIKYAGAGYLLYLGYRLWTSPIEARSIEPKAHGEDPFKLFLAGLAVTMGNPKVMVFYLALLPTIIDLTRITALGYAGLVAATMSVLAIVFSGYILLAARARGLLASPRAIRVVNRASGTVMAGAAAAIAMR
jgi:threonine/homoserine/homoserine lactone efflux protein